MFKLNKAFVRKTEDFIYFTWHIKLYYSKGYGPIMSRVSITKFLRLIGAL